MYLWMQLYYTYPITSIFHSVVDIFPWQDTYRSILMAACYSGGLSIKEILLDLDCSKFWRVHFLLKSQVAWERIHSTWGWKTGSWLSLLYVPEGLTSLLCVRNETWLCNINAQQYYFHETKTVLCKMRTSNKMAEQWHGCHGWWHPPRDSCFCLPL